eukprot:6196047-Pleurochrysis_carterae.AAC.6
MASAMALEVDGKGDAVVVENLHLARLRDALELGDLVTQLLNLALELLVLYGHWLHVKELAVKLDLEVFNLASKLLAAKAEVDQLLLFFASFVLQAES